MRYLPNNVLAQFFGGKDSELPRKTVISGSVNGMRTKLAMRIADAVFSCGHTVFILHRSNKLFNEKYASCGTCVYINNAVSTCEIDPCKGLTDNEIASMFYDVGRSIADLSFEARELISIGIETMRAEGKEPSFERMGSFPWEGIAEYIFTSERINDRNKLGLIQRLSPFSQQIPAVKTLFREITVHSEGKFNSRAQKVGIKELLMKPAVISVDISSDTNTTFAEMMLAMIKIYKEKGMKFLLILDTVPVLNEKCIAYQMYKSTDTSTPVLILSPDLVQAFSGFPEMFNDVIGSGINAVVMAHTAGNSADVWSSFFGEYYYQREDKNIGESKNNLSIFEKTKQTSVTYTEERRRNVPPENIISLDTGQAIIKFGFLTPNGMLFTYCDVKDI